MDERCERRFSHLAASVAAARTFVADALHRLSAAGRFDDVVLCVSELATNAVEHTTGDDDFVVRVTVHDGVLRVEVTDRGDGAPVLRQASTADDHGRGLFLVTVLADGWGVEPHAETGKTVWADFKLGTAAGSFPEVIAC